MSELAVLGGQPVIPSPTKELGPYTGDPWRFRDLEDAFRRHTGAKYAVRAASGTAALISGLGAVGIGPGDEVITVAHTWVASAAAILRNNGIPIFVDIDPQTYTMDASKIEAAITPRTRAILPVDLHGHPAPMFEIMEIPRGTACTLLRTPVSLEARRLMA